jgi:hypothetical protein
MGQLRLLSMVEAVAIRLVVDTPLEALSSFVISINNGPLFKIRGV